MTKQLASTAPAEPPRVVALVYDGLCTFEFGIVSEVIGLHRPELGQDLYRFSSVAVENEPIRAAGGLNVTATGARQDLRRADIVVVPGWRGKDAPVPPAISEEIRRAHERGARLLSVCSGVFVLAASGVLAGRRATTHWRYASALSQAYPDVPVEADRLYVEDGAIISSAGSSAGIDACLHIVREDYGAKVANSVARRLVMHAHRQGGQAQFIEQPLPKAGNEHRLSVMMDEVRGDLAQTYSIGSMARLAGMSPRTFQRRFLGFTGVPAMQWLAQERVAQACELLETTDLSADSVSLSVGLGNSETLRYHFRKSLGVSPLEYRKRFSA
ncbi:MAG: transcriptional regulator FtrA [Alphaproteobacteria bacterium]|nr:transcriptional regulator FtrA [Alphaproteobacteria bacterium]